MKCPKCNSTNVAQTLIGCQGDDSDVNYGHCYNCGYGAPPERVKKKYFLTNLSSNITWEAKSLYGPRIIY